MILNKNLKSVLNRNEVLKIIIGLNNFSLNDIISQAKAAEIGGATYVDIAANINIVHEIKQICNLPLCVSSIDPDELFACFQAGVDILEVGNFDIFYKKGIMLSPINVLDIAKDIMYRAPLACICVTIPHTLCLLDQICLAKQLESLGVDMIQTEGFSSKSKKDFYLVNSLRESSSALSTTYALFKNIKVPIISSSGMNPLSAAIAVSYGASGIGLGSFLLKFHDLIDRSMSIQSIIQSMHQNLTMDMSNNNLNIDSVCDHSKIAFMNK
jgi:hypothetical protein